MRDLSMLERTGEAGSDVYLKTRGETALPLALTFRVGAVWALDLRNRLERPMPEGCLSKALRIGTHSTPTISGCRGEPVGNLWVNGTCPLDWPLRFRDDVIAEGLSWTIT